MGDTSLSARSGQVPKNVGFRLSISGNVVYL